MWNSEHRFPLQVYVLDGGFKLWHDTFGKTNRQPFFIEYYSDLTRKKDNQNWMNVQLLLLFSFVACCVVYILYINGI